MKWIISLLAIVALALAFTTGLYFEELPTFLEWGLTGAAVQDISNSTNSSSMYSWTTALCGTNNRCIDIVVECNGSRILNVTPISAAVWHSEDWVDPRGGNPEQLCR